MSRRPRPAWRKPPSAPQLDAGQAAIWLLAAGQPRPLETVLALYLGVDVASVMLDRSPSRKPRLRGSTLDASLSHGGGTCLVGIVRCGKIGVDVEAPRPGIETWSLVSQVLTRREHARWSALPPEQRAPAFLSVWTRKEALLKAVGVGLEVDPRLIEFGDDGRLVAAPREFGPLDDWTLIELAVVDSFAVAAASSTVTQLELYDARDIRASTESRSRAETYASL
jgi:phosphopantetheinyl transferase